MTLYKIVLMISALVLVPILLSTSVSSKVVERIPEMPELLKNMVRQGARIRYMGSEGGLDAWQILRNDQEQFLYATPDHQYVLLGLLFDKKGRMITTQQVINLSERGEYITRADFEGRGLDWPLTVDEGRIGCAAKSGLKPVWFQTENGVRYNVNGAADTIKLYRAIDSIWADSPDYEGLKINIGDLISEGLKTCPPASFSEAFFSEAE